MNSVVSPIFNPLLFILLFFLLLREISQNYIMETSYATDAESLFFQGYEWSDTFIKVMYDKAL